MSFNPVLYNPNQVVTPPPDNELDRCTVVSIFPMELTEEKHTLQPGKWIIPAGNWEKPAIIVVGSSYYVRDLGQEEPNYMTIPVPSMMIADSLCKDLAMLASTPTSGPGLFWVKGERTLDDIKKNNQKQLQAAKERQERWYRELIQLADVDWSKNNGNPLAVSETARLAARELGQKDKDWLKDQQHYQKISCIACGTFNTPGIVVCPSCKVVLDPEKAVKLGLKFAS